jgi:hypothetical protein
MGIVGVHPAVFVRVASKGVRGYGKWKSGEVIDFRGIVLCGSGSFLKESGGGERGAGS